MIELDPKIMRRSLPPNIYATIDQVTANVNAAVDEIIDRFAKNAQATVDKIEKGDFAGEIAKALEQAKKDLNEDITSMDARLQAVNAAVAKANELAKQAGDNATALTTQLAAVNGAAAALQNDLNAFRTKVDTFASKSGSLIASTALKAVGVA